MKKDWFFKYTLHWFRAHDLDFHLFLKRAKDYDGGDGLMYNLKTKGCNLGFIIDAAFYWAETPEGHDFWEEVNHKFLADFNKQFFCDATHGYAQR